MKENNHICIEYDIPKTPCAFHLSFVKEKQQMLKKSNIPSPYYAILFLSSSLGHLGHRFRKISLKNLCYW